MKKPNFAAMNPVVAEAIQQIMAEQGDKFSLEEINLADLGRRTGISRAKLRRMKEHDFEDVQHALKGRQGHNHSPEWLHRHFGRPTQSRHCKLCCVP